MTDADVLELLQTAVLGAGPDRLLGELGRYDELDRSRVDRVVGGFLVGLARSAWEHGWAPADVVQHASRELEQGTEPLLLALIAAEHRSYKLSTIDARWREQLTELGIGHPFAELELTSWAAERRLGRYVVLHQAVALVQFLSSLPRLARIFPLPGAARPGSSAAAGRGSPAQAGVDAKVLGRIRALLAKAEATEFPDEAEALSAKAQELMAKFSLDRTLLEAGPGLDVPDHSGARRIWVETPYVSAKAALVDAVATANNCRTVAIGRLALVTIVGSELDLRLTELLATSLLVQANRAMLAAGKHFGRYGESRTRSFRQSFLMAYADRVGERLRTTAEAAIPETDRERLLPVLGKRQEQVDALFTQLFPRTVARRTRVTNGAGWEAGRTAADLAELHTRRPVGGRR